MGNFGKVIDDYLSNPKFKDYAPSTQSSWKRALLLAGKTMGFLEVEDIDSAVVQAHLDELADFPGKQTIAKAALQALEKWALVRRRVHHPFTIGTQAIRSAGGHEPWTDEQVETAIKHAGGELPRVIRLAIETGQRGSDIVKMRWSDITEHEGRQGVGVTQQKTGRKLWVPLTMDFVQTLSTWERRPPFFLILAPDGRQYTRNRLSHDWTLERDSNPALADLRGKVLHGLRASTVIRFRKMGFTELEISSFIGMSEPMVARYSRLANQQKMAIASVERIENFRGNRAKALQEKANGIKGPTF